MKSAANNFTYAFGVNMNVVLRLFWSYFSNGDVQGRLH